MQGLISKVRKMHKIEKDIAQLDIKKAKLEEEKDRLIDQIIPEMLNSGIQNLKLEGIGTAYIAKKESINIIDLPEFFDYLEKTGNGDMIKRQVNWQTLNSWWSRMEEEDRPDIRKIGLGAQIKTVVAIRKS